MSVRITLQEVAAAARVSPSTASYALRGNASIRPATRARVAAAALQLGYVPDRAAAMLRSRRAGHKGNRPVVAILAQTHTEPFLMAQVRETNEIARTMAVELGFFVEEVLLNPGAKFETIIRQLKARGVQGVLLRQRAYDFGESGVDWSDFSVVALEIAPNVSYHALHRVRNGFIEGVERIWERMHERGYRRVGAALFQHPQATRDDLALLGMALGCQATYPRAGSIPPLQTVHGDQEGFKHWFRKYRPDAILGLHEGVPWWLQDEGCIPGRDVGLALLVYEKREEHSFDCTGLPLTHAAMVGPALRFLTHLVEQGERGVPRQPQEIILHPEWHEGATLPPRDQLSGVADRPVQNQNNPPR